MGSRSGNKIMIGMPVRVVVASVDTDLNRVDFVLEEGSEGVSAKRSPNKGALRSGEVRIRKNGKVVRRKGRR